MCDFSSFKLCLQVPCMMSSFCFDCCETECPCFALCCFCPCYFYKDNKSKTKNETSPLPQSPPKYTEGKDMEK